MKNPNDPILNPTHIGRLALSTDGLDSAVPKATKEMIAASARRVNNELKFLAQQDDLYSKRGPRTQEALFGVKYGRLTLHGPIGHDSRRKLLVLCRCDCGIWITKRFDALKRDGVKSCGCLKSSKGLGRDEYIIRRFMPTAFAKMTQQAQAEAEHDQFAKQYEQVWPAQAKPSHEAADIAAIQTVVKASNLFGVNIEPILSDTHSEPIGEDIKARASARETEVNQDEN